jgi:Icc-related predicted phosphoesterase
VLAFSDLHRNVDRAGGVARKAARADVVIGAGDFGTLHRGLRRVIDVLRAIELPAVLVAGNHETPDELREACAEWPSAVVLHGDRLAIGGVDFFGLGAAVPPTPLPWGFDMSEVEAAARLVDCPAEGVLVVHSPPRGQLDRAMGRHLGSRSVLETIERRAPRLVVCGHIHQWWGREAQVGPTRILNAGPHGVLLRL